jgi:hypothetical protein
MSHIKIIISKFRVIALPYVIANIDVIHTDLVGNLRWWLISITNVAFLFLGAHYFSPEHQNININFANTKLLFYLAQIHLNENLNIDKQFSINEFKIEISGRI